MDPSAGGAPPPAPGGSVAALARCCLLVCCHLWTARKKSVGVGLLQLGADRIKQPVAVMRLHDCLDKPCCAEW
jgi:hypothetical protein